MSYLRRMFVVLTAVVILTIPALPSIAQGLEGSLNVSSEEALRRDAAEYASTMKVSLDEAIRRLLLQDAIGDLNASLTTKERDTFAGIWIQHQPEYRVIVQFTQGGEATIQRYIAHTPLAHITEVRTANVTFNELEAARSRAADIARMLNIGAYSAIDVVENRAELYVLDPTIFYSAAQARTLSLPSQVAVLKVNELPQPVADIYGGLALSNCTSGFSVKDSAGVKGITTAGHCPNDLWYAGVQLPFRGGTLGGAKDIQWHTAPGFTVRNWIYDGYGNRAITKVKFHVDQPRDTWVCKYGKITGYACGQIILNNVDGINIAVRIQVQEGDSGGPWFWQDAAFGTTISRATFDDGSTGAIYGPVNHIYDVLRLTIITN